MMFASLREKFADMLIKKGALSLAKLHQTELCSVEVKMRRPEDPIKDLIESFLKERVGHVCPLTKEQEPRCTQPETDGQSKTSTPPTEGGASMENQFTQLCVWPGCVMGDNTPEDFEKYLLEEMDVRVKFAEEVTTNGSVERHEEGGRKDLLFFIHADDISKFAGRRLMMGIRWWEDVVSYNDGAYLYSEEILNKYPVTW